ncbi:MAG: DUF6629 family protein [Candidatus Paceibacterota bacterium]|jgi:hypothetical protein
MCFSATASFTAGAVLTATGVVTIKKAKEKSELPFATIPLLFGVQQFVEGGVWLSFKYGLPILNKLGTYAFMLFAYVFWPVFIPYAVGRLETDIHRKKIILGFQYLGVVVALYLLSFILSKPMTSHIVNQCIGYSTIPFNIGVPVVGAYILATCGSALFSTHKIINLLGILGVLSFAGMYYFYTQTFVSVWCFFAAILSVIIYFYFQKQK